jgi:hypothetical protein
MVESVFFDRKVPVVLFQEDGIWFAHCAALEITGYGLAEQDAQESFEVMLKEFFRYASEQGTLRSDLARLGWQVETRTPPPFETLISRDKTLKSLFDSKPVHTIWEPIPAYS